MISYEKAKKLKESEFPQDFKDGDLEMGLPYPSSPTVDGRSWIDVHKEYLDSMVYKPTLSELIDELGNKFKFLERLLPPNEEGKWWAESTMTPACIGDTPEEAVANLYLLLKKEGKI